jgi:hypothetical protein
MLYVKQALFRPRDDTDRDVLIKFFLSITGHSMYRPIIDEMCKSPGFKRKELHVIDDASGTIAMNKLVFSDEENFNAYLAHEGYQSTWEYLTIMADGEGIDCEISNLVVEE